MGHLKMYTTLIILACCLGYLIGAITTYQVGKFESKVLWPNQKNWWDLWSATSNGGDSVMIVPILFWPLTILSVLIARLNCLAFAKAERVVLARRKQAQLKAQRDEEFEAEFAKALATLKDLEK